MKSRHVTVCPVCEAAFHYNRYKVERQPDSEPYRKGVCDLCGKKRTVTDLIVTKPDKGTN